CRRGSGWQWKCGSGGRRPRCRSRRRSTFQRERCAHICERPMAPCERPMAPCERPMAPCGRPTTGRQRDGKWSGERAMSDIERDDTGHTPLGCSAEQVEPELWGIAERFLAEYAAGAQPRRAAHPAHAVALIAFVAEAGGMAALRVAEAPEGYSTTA